MSAAVRTILSMSLSGSLLILVLLAGGRLWRGRASRQWQYYLWLIVVLRLLLPFGVEVHWTVPDLPEPPAIQAVSSPGEAVPVEWWDPEDSASPPAGAAAFQMLWDHLWLVWLAGTLGLLVRRITVYQSFARYVSSGSSPVPDVGLLDQLAVAAEQAGVRRPVELCVNPLISSPLLIGFFRPCIVLPSADISERDFHYTVLHELIHCKRRDMLYKWLVQLAACLHWFNPLVHLMSREITRACEFSCDEAVLLTAGPSCAQDYGSALLDAMAAVGKYRASTAAVTLSENKQLLKERINAMMNFRKQSIAVKILTVVLTVCVLCGASFLGVRRAAAADSPASVPAEKPAAETKEKDGASSSRIERYYEAGSLPLFQIEFSRLEEAEQRTWLKRIYGDGKISFFSVGVDLLKAGSPIIGEMAEKVYQDGSIAFFSVLAGRMDKDTLEDWLDRALDDGAWSFQSVLFNKLEMDDELDALEEELAQRQVEEYKAHGVIKDGKAYYYEGKLVNIFLDIRKDSSFYTLDMNPLGTVNVKITRDADGEIKTVGFMPDAEAEELLRDMSDDDEETVPVELETVAAGEAICLGEYTLSDGDQIMYDISAKTGKGMKVYFTKDGRKDPVYWSVHNLRQKDEPLRCALDVTVESPAKSGTYQLFLQAPDGALGGVKGNVSVTKDS